MKGTKILRALSNRRREYNEMKGEPLSVHSKYVPLVGALHEPGSTNPRAGYAAPRGERKRKHVAPMGGGNPSRSSRRQGTKSATRVLVQRATRGSARKAAKAVRQAGTGDTF